MHVVFVALAESIILFVDTKLKRQSLSVNLICFSIANGDDNGNSIIRWFWNLFDYELFLRKTCFFIRVRAQAKLTLSQSWSGLCATCQLYFDILKLLTRQTLKRTFLEDLSTSFDSFPVPFVSQKSVVCRHKKRKWFVTVNNCHFRNKSELITM